MNLTLQSVPLDRITVAPQVRTQFSAESIAGLAESIAESGLQQPVLCAQEKDTLRLIDGERRFRACHTLGWKTIPVLIAADRVTAVDALASSLVSNLQREDLSPLDRAEGMRQLMEKGAMTADQVAKRLGQSPATVSRQLALLKLPDAIKAKLASGELSADSAYLLARVDDPARQASLAQEAADGKLSRDGLQRKLRRARRAEAGGSVGPNRVTALLGAGRSITVAGKALSLDSLIETLEQLLSRAKRSKSQGLSLATFVRTLRDQAN
ncbi:Chromosome-partitioning protein Spo0J [Phycisphaerae bacterium RAS1]|nr:Chromosome-partitioning protein Spo0J [Phycisphaerae bacterium RAS1]